MRGPYTFALPILIGVVTILFGLGSRANESRFVLKYEVAVAGEVISSPAVVVDQHEEFTLEAGPAEAGGFFLVLIAAPENAHSIRLVTTYEKYGRHQTERVVARFGEEYHFRFGDVTVWVQISGVGDGHV